MRTGSLVKAFQKICYNNEEKELQKERCFSKVQNNGGLIKGDQKRKVSVNKEYR